MDGERLQCTSSKTLSDSLLVTGFTYLHDFKYDLSFEIFKEFYDKTRGVRRLGAASLDLCFIAMGRFDGYYEYGLQPWDICAGALIAKEAGAKVTDWDNLKLPHDGSRILATISFIHNQMVGILTQEKYRIYY
jgi:myo-inositol-1(or 4)-monophosphatase